MTNSTLPTVGPLVSPEAQQWFVLGASLLSIVFGLLNVHKVLQIKISSDADDENAAIVHNDASQDYKNTQVEQTMVEISKLIQDGSTTFLKQEYLYTTVFIAIFALIISLTVEPKFLTFYTTGPFLLGSVTSIVSGYIGMQIAVRANVRTAKQAQDSLDKAFNVAFRGGMVLGFVLVGLALLVLHLLIAFYVKNKVQFFGGDISQQATYLKLFEAIAGYGLGGSTVALFGRVGGGIFTKAADVGADLVGKVIENLDEDDYRNPGVIADNVGDNVGDIAGMGSDLFGSFAESTCACLVISASSAELVQANAFYYPLTISAAGIFVGIVTIMLTVHLITVDEADKVEFFLKIQLVLSTVLMTPCLYYCAIWTLPANFEFKNVEDGGKVTPMYAFICTALGLWSGLCIGWFTEFYTSQQHAPVKNLAAASNSGAAPNIILGLALGYRSTMIPIFCIAVSIFVSFSLANMFGISLAALGMLSTLTIALTIDGFGPISDNAGGICEMAKANEWARRRTDALDSAGNTTAAIGKGFAIGSACLVALALFGAFVTRSNLNSVNILRPLEFSGLIVGAMLPYYFCAMTMEAVGDAAFEMIEEIKSQFSNPGIRNGTVRPDYERCISISTKASINAMMGPGALVLLTPLVVGFIFGPRAVCGLLAGAIVSGVQIAISMSNSGGAWDNAKKFIEAGKLSYNGVTQLKHSDAHKAAVVGDTVGDPLKDTSGPSINILIKLMAITSLVFGGAFVKQGGLLLPYIGVSK